MDREDKKRNREDRENREVKGDNNGDNHGDNEEEDSNNNRELKKLQTQHPTKIVTFTTLEEYTSEFIEKGSIGPVNELLIFDPFDGKIKFVETMWDAFDLAHQQIPNDKRDDQTSAFFDFKGIPQKEMDEVELERAYGLIKHLDAKIKNNTLTTYEREVFFTAFRAWRLYLEKLHRVETMKREAQSEMQKRVSDVTF